MKATTVFRRRSGSEIYANAYFYRILDCLKEDFPATLATLGADNFHNLVTGYLIEYPPTEPSIAYAGRYMSEFLRHHPLSERWPFIAELARLERTVTEVFHAAEAEPLSAETDALGRTRGLAGAHDADASGAGDRRLRVAR